MEGTFMLGRVVRIYVAPTDYLWCVGAAVVATIAAGVFSGAIAERRRRKTIEALRDHFIVCGYGRVRRRVGAELRAAGAPYAVLDSSERATAAARDLRGVVASSGSDAENVDITLSARPRRPDPAIVARASDEDAQTKLKLAGTDRVVAPYDGAFDTTPPDERVDAGDVALGVGTPDGTRRLEDFFAPAGAVAR